MNRLLISAVLLCISVSSASSSDMDILVSPGASPCDKIRMQLWENEKPLIDAYLSPDGKHKFTLGKALPMLVKKQNYRIVSDCLRLKSGSFVNSSGLNFVYDGRTLIFEFNATGYNIRRGSVR
ncbi:hypothetical protein [Deinococcus sp.]|uniref:hypothetical protein n=1 Tax=Deinococcus sp. TaxID=47478 RepID=UPI0025DC71E0|nr:hypothetical protein [Deinococcus sp.]